MLAVCDNKWSNSFLRFFCLMSLGLDILIYKFVIHLFSAVPLFTIGTGITLYRYMCVCTFVKLKMKVRLICAARISIQSLVRYVFLLIESQHHLGWENRLEL